MLSNLSQFNRQRLRVAMRLTAALLTRPDANDYMVGNITDTALGMTDRLLEECGCGTLHDYEPELYDEPAALLT